jgi:fucose 4-O-acetylase-like acetyltransferase
MRPSIALRIASIVTLVLAAGHTSGFPWTPNQTPAGAVLVSHMKSIHFDVMGFSRTYWDFYLGFGLTISVCLLLFAVLLWQLGAAANTEPQRARPAIATLFVGFAAIALLDWLNFFYRATGDGGCDRALPGLGVGVCPEPAQS